MDNHTFVLGELFCGPGGLSLGASKARAGGLSVQHGWANDYDDDTCETFLKNIELADNESVICEDVRKIDIENLSPIDAFAYGFPCNDFSVVGKQKGFNGLFGPLYSYGIKVINKFNPHFFVAENVGGLSSANSGMALKKILEDLKTAGKFGYEITAHLFKSEEYGVAQTRHRIIMVGIRKDHCFKFKVPKTTHNKNNFTTVKMALECPAIEEDATNNERTRQSEVVKERLSYIKPGQNVWTADLPEHLQLNVKGARMSQIYKKLDPNKPSYTITGSGGGGTHGYHYSENRALTNRERARIQSFPDDYLFHGSKESVRKQIGMAVPPELSKVVFDAILKSFAKIEYEYIKPSIQ